jgi:hypothetical protein
VSERSGDPSPESKAIREPGSRPRLSNDQLRELQLEASPERALAHGKKGARGSSPREGFKSPANRLILVAVQSSGLSITRCVGLGGELCRRGAV